MDDDATRDILERCGAMIPAIARWLAEAKAREAREATKVEGGGGGGGGSGDSADGADSADGGGCMEVKDSVDVSTDVWVGLRPCRIGGLRIEGEWLGREGRRAVHGGSPGAGYDGASRGRNGDGVCEGVGTPGGGGGAVWCIHNYGHGGAGFTVSWGAAARVRGLLAHQFPHLVSPPTPGEVSLCAMGGRAGGGGEGGGGSSLGGNGSGGAPRSHL